MKRALALILTVVVGLSITLPLHAHAISPTPNLAATSSATSASTPADNSFNLVTSPLPISLAGPPGSTLTTDIRVKNGGTSTTQLKVTLMKFSAYGDEGKPAIADRGPGDDYFDWVTFSPQVFD